MAILVGVLSVFHFLSDASHLLSVLPSLNQFSTVTQIGNRTLSSCSEMGQYSRTVGYTIKMQTADVCALLFVCNT